MKYLSLVFTGILLVALVSCKNQQVGPTITDQLVTNARAEGQAMTIQFYKGKAHNHPTFALWIEDLEGNYIESLFVTRYLATGIYGHGSLGEGKWDSKPGEAKRPATLPYWLHKRGIKADGETYLPTPDQPVADAISGATPLNDFVLSTKTTKALPEKFRLMLEINQPWDWNSYWHNNLYPDDADYKSSCQPALVYAVTIDQANLKPEYYLNPIGHSHYAGKDGELYTDLSTITSAREIVHKVKVQFSAANPGASN
ncbi:MAG: hypothetical protein JXR22_12645 [Prolixibacteraceae bacterium]|nr:hypothetical protein [Prolixibacteraceae bacterium]